MTGVDLSPSAVDAVATRVIEMLRAEPETETGGTLVDASAVATRFGVSRAYVYEHSAALGAIKLGDGDKARLRFDLAIVAERLGAQKPAPAKPAPRRRNPSAGIALLPIRGGRS